MQSSLQEFAFLTVSYACQVSVVRCSVLLILLWTWSRFGVRKNAEQLLMYRRRVNQKTRQRGTALRRRNATNGHEHRKASDVRITCSLTSSKKIDYNLLWINTSEFDR